MRSSSCWARPGRELGCAGIQLPSGDERIEDPTRVGLALVPPAAIATQIVELLEAMPARHRIAHGDQRIVIGGIPGDECDLGHGRSPIVVDDLVGTEPGTGIGGSPRALAVPLGDGTGRQPGPADRIDLTVGVERGHIEGERLAHYCVEGPRRSDRRNVFGRFGRGLLGGNRGRRRGRRGRSGRSGFRRGGRIAGGVVCSLRTDLGGAGGRQDCDQTQRCDDSGNMPTQR